MTSEQMMSLDRLSAIHIMGWVEWPDPYTIPDGECWYLEAGTSVVHVNADGDHRYWEPTHNLNQCAELDAAVREKGWFLAVETTILDEQPQNYFAVYRDSKRHSYISIAGETESIARVLVALKAMLGTGFERTLKEAGMEV